MKIPRPHRPVRSTVLAISVGINLFVAMLTILAAYGGTFNPDTRVIMAMIAMTFPAMLLLGMIVMTADLFFDRRLALIIAGGWLISIQPILSFSPLHILGHSLSEQEKERSFTLLTYNILHYCDFRGENPELEANATMSYILSTDADIVNLQEAGPELTCPGRLNMMESGAVTTGDYWHMKQSQLDSLYARYPYRVINRDNQLSVYSKYPVTPVRIHIPPKDHNVMECFRLDIKGQTVHLINVHLKSIGLTDADKALYKQTFRNVPDSKQELRSEINDVKSQLLSKLAVAFRDRAAQANTVKNVIDSIGGPFIVAGDFNDIPDCYAVRRILSADGMNDAYADAAFGPAITYHGDRFYFRIDHVLYRGPFKAIDIERGGIYSSDHNPLLTTFLFDKDLRLQPESAP